MPLPSAGAMPCAFSITTSAYIKIRRRYESQTKRGLLVAAIMPGMVLLVSPMLSTVSIMPGMELRAPERQLTSSGSWLSPYLRPISFSTWLKAAAICSSRPAGKQLPAAK